MSIPDADLTNLNRDIATWQIATAQPANDYSELIAQIKAVLKAMNPNDPQSISRAYLMFAGPIMIQALNFKADNLGALGSTLNINSDIQAFVTSMQNNATFIANNANATARSPTWISVQKAGQDLELKLRDLLNALPAANTTPTGDSAWISESTNNALVGSLVNIANLLAPNAGPRGGEQTQSSIAGLSDEQMFSIADTDTGTIINWAQNLTPPPPTTPGGTPPAGTQGNQQMQNLYQFFTQSNNAVSTQNNATQALIQQESAQYTQYEGITNKGLTEISSLNRAENQHMASG